jgi:hypothetical protein
VGAVGPAVSAEYRISAREPKPKPDDPEQSRRFIEAAKYAEADETEKGVDKAFRNVF